MRAVEGDEVFTSIDEYLSSYDENGTKDRHNLSKQNLS